MFPVGCELCQRERHKTTNSNIICTTTLELAIYNILTRLNVRMVRMVRMVWMMMMVMMMASRRIRRSARIRRTDADSRIRQNSDTSTRVWRNSACTCTRIRWYADTREEAGRWRRVWRLIVRSLVVWRMRRKAGCVWWRCCNVGGNGFQLCWATGDNVTSSNTPKLTM